METTPFFNVPITQSGELMTEDMFLDRQNVLESLGTSQEATELRQQLQTKSLVSDMQAFKAANPSCEFADFIRWHSQKDWSEGGVSARMRSADNLWRTSWDSAEPCAVEDQGPLFDVSSEAERYCTTLRPYLRLTF